MRKTQKNTLRVTPGTHADHFKKYNADKNYDNVKFDRESGGLQAFHKKHHFDRKTGKYEKHVADILHKNGHKIILEDESSATGKQVDGFLDDKPMDISSISGEGKNTVVRALLHSRSKRAETAVLYFPDKKSYTQSRIDNAISRFYGQSEGYNLNKIIVIVEDEIIRQ